MTRLIPSLVAIVGISLFVVAAGADEHYRRGQGGERWQPRQHESWGNWGGISQIASEFKKHHSHQPEPKKQPIPIDPGRGDGRVPTPVPTPPARPGFVWVGDHWERAKAPPKAPSPYPPDVIIRDHRTPSGSFPAGTQVRDHRTTESFPGGTTVQSNPRTPSPAGGGVIVTKPWTGDSTPVVRDHRTTPIVRDHRTTPVVRDHREVPVVRDHRQ